MSIWVTQIRLVVFVDGDVGDCLLACFFLFFSLGGKVTSVEGQT